MRRLLVALPLLLVLALTSACGEDDDKGDDTSSDSSQTASADPSDSGSTDEEPGEEETDTGESEEPTPSTGAVSEEQFCKDAEEALHGSSTNEILQQVATVVANGLPEGMPQSAVDGIQVLIDIAPELETSASAMQALQGLSGDQLSAVASLSGYLTATCGKNLVAQIVPWLQDLPSEMASMLPSELTAP